MPWHCFFRDPAGARTQDPNIKSVVLYLLSYRVIAFFAAAKVRLFSLSGTFCAKNFSFVQQTLALTNDNYLIVSAIHDGTLLVLARTTIDDDVHQILVTVVDFLRVGEEGVDFVFLIGQRSGHDRRAELPDDVGDDRLVGDADTNGFLLALEDARDVVVGLQDEGERPWQVALHHLEDVVVDRPCELA